jgi:hypothetical protein
MGRPHDVTFVHIDSGLLPVGAQLLCLVTDIVDKTNLRNVMQAWHTPVKLATGWTVRGSNAGGGEIFRTFPDRPWGPPSLLYNG